MLKSLLAQLLFVTLVNKYLELYWNIIHLLELQNIVGAPNNGYDVTDRDYLNLLLNNCNVEITSVLEKGVYV